MTAHPARRVLVVDDHPATRYATARVLRANGFEAVEAATGAEALALAGAAIDLVILDINLPDLDGMTVCRMLRERSETHRVPVIHLSASRVGETDKALGLDAGADGYLTHPVEPAVLVSTINAFLRTRGAEEEMRRSEAKFRAVFNEALSGIAILDNSLKLRDVNVALTRMLGVSRDALNGTRIAELLGTTAQGLLEDLQRGQPLEGVFPRQRDDGTSVQLEWHISPHTIAGEHLAIVNDITEQIQHAEEREQLIRSERAARAEAERANRIKDDFLATLSHELRNPLSAIVGWCNVLKVQARGTPMADAVAGIMRNADVQAQLIAELLDVSRIASGKLSLLRSRIDAGDVIREALRTLAPAAEKKGISLDASLNPSALPVVADPVRLQQVLWNLLSNSVKFTDRGGRVRVTATIEDTELCFTVSDTGSGIAADLLPHVFERFRQDVPRARRGEGGLGLGLAIVKQLVEMHGGTVVADSPGPGRGSSFRVRLPNAGVAAQASPEPMLSDQALQGQRILVVDDDPDSRAIICRILSDAGAQTADAPDAQSAMAQIQGFAPTVLISDIGMEPHDGYDLIRQVRADNDPSALPALALTAFTQEEDRLRSLAAGYQAHLGKPFEPRQLVATVATLRPR